MTVSAPAYQHSYTSNTVATFVTVSIISGASLSYLGNGQFSFPGYALAFFGIATAALLYPVPALGRTYIVVLASVTATLGTLAAMVFSPYEGGAEDALQALVYPITGLGLLLFGWRLLTANTALISRLCAWIAAVNAAVAIMGSIGWISHLPLIGSIETGRLIFGTNLPSSTGLFGNVNYYSTGQAVLWFLFVWLGACRRNSESIPFLLMAIVLFFSVFIGSSRGVLAALLVSLSFGLAMYWVTLQSRDRLWVALLSCLTVSLFSFAILLSWDAVYHILRLERGLNFRDALWRAGIQIWLERPLLGWGYAGAATERLGEMTGREASLHNGYLESLVRSGIFGFLLSYGLAIVLFIFSLIKNRKNLRPLIWPAMLVIFWLVNTAVRTFSFGGLGLLPVASVTALSVMVFYRPCLAKS